MDLSNLPKVVFTETDATKIKEAVLAAYTAASGRTLKEGDPVRLFLNSLIAIIILLRQSIQTAGEQNLLSKASGASLDNLGALLNVERNAGNYTVSTERFNIASALAFVVPIPIGTRVTADGSVIFETTEYAEIPIGSLYIDVPIRALTTGTDGNDLVAGQINQMVDAVSYITSVSNTTTSSGGTEEEDDDSFRARIQLAPESFSTAGPTLAYKFFVLSTNSAIIDTSVTSPDDGEVDIRVLMEGGTLPSSEVLAAVLEKVSADKIRPLTDKVTVAAPSAVSYNINITWYLSSASKNFVSTITANVATAINEYKEWQQSAIGRDINPDELIAKIKAAGAKRVVITTPVFTEITDTQVAQIGTTTVNYGGIEDE